MSKEFRLSKADLDEETLASLPLDDRWVLSGDWHEAFDSSNVKRMRYDFESQDLWVDFLGDGAYDGHYKNVPEVVAKNFYKSMSKGKYLHAHLKNAYSWHRS